MKRIEDLFERAKKLKEKGLTTGEIADELNVSRETALWLLTKAREDLAPPSDIYIEWRKLATPFRMKQIANIMVDMILETIEQEPEVVVGIATSGIPLATIVAEELNTDLSIYYPKKLKWEKDVKHISGVFSENYARVDGKKCVIIDDIISTGRTIEEVAEHINKKDGKVLCAAVIVDKRGSDTIDSIPIASIIKIVRI
ncbi:orotate phosphoribosyltransferase-like protein [Archaeoglobales archaeon]|nr:MAG: orotate phosphoribosyltransferase-like protein [Archaeoglobales archaeon]